MPKKIPALLFLMLTLCFGLGAESFVGKSIFSFDLGYMGLGLKNNGWGLGISYERELFPYFAMKGGFSHMTMFPKEQVETITTVGIFLEALYYPFGRGLDWLYLGFGCDTDFLMYIGTGSVETAKDTLISVFPKIGWKQNFLDYVMLDVYAGYSVLLTEPLALSYDADLVQSGFEYGARIRLNLGKIFSFLFPKKD